MRTSYVTDNFSSLAGLAAVAYNDSEFFREVKNQIYSDSETFFVDQSRPSAILEGLFINKTYLTYMVKNGLDKLNEGSISFEFLLSVLGEDWKDNFSSNVINSLLLEVDSSSEYFYSSFTYLEIAIVKVTNNYFTRLFNYTIENNFIESITTELINVISSAFQSDPLVGIDSETFFKIINNNPQTKISKVKPDSVIPLYNQIEIGEDYRGVKIEAGYLRLEDYYNNIAYPNTDL
jgi:hypothetical protein